MRARAEWTARGFSHQKAQNANTGEGFGSLRATVSEAEPPSPPPPPPDEKTSVLPALPGLAAPPTPGERHIGKYLVKRELGRGGMGAVYLAEQPGLGRMVAIKELLVSAAADPTALTRFLQEAQVMARTSHPNLVQVYDLEEVDNAKFIILEFVKGQSMRELLNRGRIPIPQVFAVMHGVLQGLDYAHRHNIVHRDMKPENVLMSDEGEVKVADFGIARLTDDSGSGSTATKTGTTVGTPQYMSPEQVASSKVDGRSDLYSAGIMLYESVCGRPPFVASEADGPFTLMAKHVQAPPPPPALHRPDVDPELEEVILKALSKRPEDRYQTGDEFDQALNKVANRLTPGWQRSLLPGADLGHMTAAGVDRTMVLPSTPALPRIEPAPAAPAAAPVSPPIPAYNPAPPVPKGGAAKRAAAGCLGLLALTAALPALAAAVLHVL
jgi:eukaryotic-like serine/threonine-protein kinase